jgi:alpha-amylase
MTAMSMRSICRRDYLNHANCIGWTREGDEEHAGSGCAVLLSNGDAGFKTMEMGKIHAGKTFVDFLGNDPGTVTVDADGRGEFHVNGVSVSVWVEQGV